MRAPSLPLSSLSGPAPCRPVAGYWPLPAGRALTLRPRERSVLEVACGGVWLTVNGIGRAAAQDIFLAQGDRHVLLPGQCAVLEAWPAGSDGARFACQPEVAAVPQRNARQEWQRSVAQPWAELAVRWSAGWEALRGVGAASGRLVRGLARVAVIAVLGLKAAPERVPHSCDS